MHRSARRAVRAACASLLFASLTGCGAANTPDGAKPAPCTAGNCVADIPSVPVTLALSSADQAELTSLNEQLAPLRELSASQLLERAPKFQNELGYDPLEAAGLDLIQGSALSLDDAELAKLGHNGFVIAKRHRFANMAYGLKSIYAADLPLYVSVDTILDAVHSSYDTILQTLEEQLLIARVRDLLTGARQNLQTGAVADAVVAQDLDLYLGVALSLLEGKLQPSVAGAEQAQVSQFFQQAERGQDILPVTLFGVERDVDFSQFTVRGHYTNSAELERYFRALIWLGRTDFRLIETQEDGSRVFHRRQLEASLALRDVVRGEAAAAYAQIDAVLTAFVGDHDYMQIGELDRLLAALGSPDREALRALPDAQIAQAILDGGFGSQRIASQVIFKDLDQLDTELPLDRSLALLGQRFVVDSQVFSEVTYDRVLPTEAGQLRTLPDPLDAAYAALGNSAALPLLGDELEQFEYAPHLARMRALIDAHDDSFWQSNLYNLWLTSLRVLSPDAIASSEGMPSVTRTEAWSRRMLNTQLASWAQLRHDTILYAKQSVTAGAACEYPDAYVDPYPEAFGAIAAFAVRGKQVVDQLEGLRSLPLAQHARDYYGELESIANILRDMAEQQKTGVAFNEAQLAFINDAVKGDLGCGGPVSYSGWYSRLMFSGTDAELKPTIADVHTDPGGNRPPQVLHVATGYPRLMVVTTDTCNGPRAYAGPAFAYHELVTGLERLNDEQWAPLATQQPAEVPWVDSIVQ